MNSPGQKGVIMKGKKSDIIEKLREYKKKANFKWEVNKSVYLPDWDNYVRQQIDILMQGLFGKR